MTKFIESFLSVVLLVVLILDLTGANQDHANDELFPADHRDHTQVLQAAKSLFGTPKAVPVTSAIKRLQILRDHAEEAGINLPIDSRELLELNETSETKCNNSNLLREMFDTLSSVKFSHRALTNYIEDCLRRQMIVCNFTRRTINSLDNYDKATGWTLLRQLATYAKKLGSRASDPAPGQAEFKLNLNQLREALELMSKSTESIPEDLVGEMQTVCEQLFDHEDLLRMSLMDPTSRGDKEARRLHKYLGSCLLLQLAN